MTNSRVSDVSTLPRSAMRWEHPNTGSGSVPDGVLVVSTDANGIVTWCSAAVEGLVGRPRQALVGSPFPLDVFDREQLERRAAAAGVACGHGVLLLDPRRFDRRSGVTPSLGDLDRRRSPRRGATGEGAAGNGCRWDVVGADGDRRVVSLTVAPEYDASGHAVGYVACGIDMTEEHRTSTLLAQALAREQEATRRLLELEQLRTDFVSTASHELRTPLTNILGFVELLAHDVDDPGQKQDFLSAIRRNARRIEDLAEGLLVLSAPGTKCDRPHVPVDVRDVVEAVRAPLQVLSDSYGVQLELVCPEHRVEAEGDSSRLGLVVRHLVDNALKFTPGGGRVVCTVAASPRGVTIEVSDTGPGVPPSELPYLFSPFFRGEAAQKNAVPGAGLGLSMVAAVVEEHGGRLLVSQNEPQGSTFTVCLPPPPR